MREIIAKTILSANNTMNLYRGCPHGCIYCDSRSNCYHIDHDFEDVEVKINAPELLKKQLGSRRSHCMIATGSMSDPYQPLEKRYRLTQKALQLIEQYGFGVSILTKSDLILRDLSLLKRINEKTKAVVQMTITTADDALCKLVEPNVCPSSRRYEVLKTMNENGIPTIVWLTPLLPFINDNEQNLLTIVRECAKCGVYGILIFGLGMTLREGNREYYYQQLDKHFPGLKERYQKTYGNSYILGVPEQNRLLELFHKECRRYGIKTNEDAIFSYLNTFENKETKEQLTLF